jgi:hypothetical protein
MPYRPIRPPTGADQGGRDQAKVVGRTEYLRTP